MPFFQTSTSVQSKKLHQISTDEHSSLEVQLVDTALYTKVLVCDVLVGDGAEPGKYPHP